ncbi:MAG: nucleotidyltransferase domain-containing protein [Planctomycetes bacterium]|nr:nucleotidyltransferase domain-containing protein [Planctomycetota bacterium]
MTEPRILAALERIEREHDVRVLYACESGSRAWGFPSADSDYDARFLYLQRPEHYLALDLEARRDVIELPIVDDLDVNGWDLRKALLLLRKSNPPLLEWLDSPLVYLERTGLAQALREFAAAHVSPLACGHHYLRMAQNNHRGYLQGERVRVKKYFYVLRPLLAVRWLEQGRGPVPTPFDALLETVAERPELVRCVRELVARKRSGEELAEGPRIEVLSDFLEEELARHAAGELALAPRPAPIEPLNALFLGALREVWGAALGWPG